MTKPVMTKPTMKIILEGPDGVGKTTLALPMANIFNVLLKEYNDKNSEGFDFWEGEIVRQETINSIWSRSFLSERLYAPIYNREPRLSEFEEKRLYQMATLFGYRIVVLMPRDASQLKERLTLRGDDKEVLNQIDDIIEGYKELIKKYNLKVVLV